MFVATIESIAHGELEFSFDECGLVITKTIWFGNWTGHAEVVDPDTVEGEVLDRMTRDEYDRQHSEYWNEVNNNTSHAFQMGL